MSAQLESLRHYVAEHPGPPAPAAPAGGALVVGAGKGGVGASLTASLLAIGAAAQGASVLLVDADAGFRALHLLFGVEPGPGLEGLRSADVTPDELVVPVTPTLSLLPGGTGGGSGSLAERQGLLRRASLLFNRYDLVVVDGGSRLDSVLAACGAGASRLLCVALDDRIALTATYALAKVAAERAPALVVDVLVNRAAELEGRGAAEQVTAAARHFLERPVGCAGVVPEDPSLRRAIDAGMQLPEAAAGSPAAAVLEEIASDVLLQLTARPQPVERRLLQRRS